MTNKIEISRNLLPCPFCGGPAEHSTYSGAPVIWCKGDEDCLGIMGGEEYTGTVEQLTAAWNKRAAPVVERQPAAYVLTRDDEVCYEADDGIVISNTPGDETNLYKWKPVYFDTSPPAPGAVVTREQVEIVAESIYSQWAGREGFVPWVKGGNSLKQDEARSIAWSTLHKLKELNQ